MSVLAIFPSRRAGLPCSPQQSAEGGDKIWSRLVNLEQNRKWKAHDSHPSFLLMSPVMGGLQATDLLSSCPLSIWGEEKKKKGEREGRKGKEKAFRVQCEV